MDMFEERAGSRYLYNFQRGARNAITSHTAVIVAKLAVQDSEQGSAEPDAVEQQVGIRKSSWQDNPFSIWRTLLAQEAYQ